MRTGILFSLACLFLFKPFNGSAQLVWQNVDSLYQPLPPSVHVYKSESLLDGKPSIAYYVSAELADRHIDFTTQTGRGKRFSPSEFYNAETKPLLVVNGTFFSFADNTNKNLVIRHGMLQAFNQPVLPMDSGRTQYYYLTRGAIGINKRREADVAWTFTDTAQRFAYALLNGPSTATGPKPDPQWPDIAAQLNGGGRKKIKWKMETAIGGGPVLMEMGKIAITNKEERMFVNGAGNREPRTSMGYTADGKLIILVVEGRNPGKAEGATLLQLAQIFQGLGCREALNLDGGGSSCLLVNGKETIKPSDKTGQRKVPAVFMIQANH